MLDGRRYVLELSSVILSDGNILQVGMNVTSREYLLSRIRITFAFGMIPLVFLSFVTGSLLAARTLRPITRLSGAARNIIETGNIDERLPTHGGRDELDELVVLFNRMLEKIEVLVRGMREALDTVAHDLRTPMTRLRGAAEIALQEPDNPLSLREALTQSLEESEQILTMLTTLMDISEAESGAMSFSGFPENPPTRSAVHFTDFSTAILGAYGAVLALLHLERTGVGQLVDVSLLDTACAFVAAMGVVAEYTLNNHTRPRIGNSSFYNLTDGFEAEDGWVMISAVGNEIWKRLAEVMGRRDLLDDDRFKDDDSRYHGHHPQVQIHPRH